MIRGAFMHACAHFRAIFMKMTDFSVKWAKMPKILIFVGKTSQIETGMVPVCYNPVITVVLSTYC